MSTCVHRLRASCSMQWLQGADTVIYERLDPGSEQNKRLKAVTRQHMEEFGAAGLRTLCLSYVELDRHAYDQ